MSVLRPCATLEDIEPTVLRRIEVPGAMRLDRLHLVLQAAMPWQNYHLWEFQAGDTRWGLPDPDYGDDIRPAAKATLAEAVEAAGGGAIGYLYDFGDSWQHRITVEDRTPPDPRHLYPRLTDVEGRCPPEDVGGIPGYERYIDILADPKNPQHAETLEWHGGPFDPNVPPADELRLDVLKLAKKWKPRAR
ncbi:plasmid pRiA4b ORF-3 family protein [Roseobacter weihaiensis]|uniref:plasmid pRiA4b ORF-3 family protein n=1 Tax=Roseobacter weihaiensis TaxID=2763262 RepID=UPI001D0BAD64|nr:plasmid pRiA4b ORF-3 family protein [Roseobacter sp. H9]